MTKSCVSFSNADSRSLLSFFDGERSHYTAKQWDEDAQLYYFNARWYDPETARFMTEDPVKDGLLWYAYCNNNPLKFTDPTGLRLDDDLGTDLERQDKDPEPEPEDDDPDDDNEQEQEQSRREIDEYYDNLRNRNTFGPDPDSLNDALNYDDYGQSPNQLDRIQEEVDAHLGKSGGEYGPGNMCDDWAKKRLEGAGVDTSDLFASPYSKSDVPEHMKNAKDNNLGGVNPEEGWSLVFMEDSPIVDGGHSGLLKLNNDGSVSFYDSSSDNPGALPTKHDYDNMEAFKTRGPDSYAHYESMLFIPVQPK